MAGTARDQPLETLTWEGLAEQVSVMAVRIIVGHLKKGNDPLIAALSKNISTTTLLPGKGRPFPICLLGEVNSIKGSDRDVRQSMKAGGIYSNVARIPSITIRPPKRFVENTVKYIISLNGTCANRKPESLKRRTQLGNTRSKVRKVNERRASGE